MIRRTLLLQLNAAIIATCTRAASSRNSVAAGGAPYHAPARGAENKLVFAGPAFADGPYNSVLGALGSGDKALLSQEGVLTRLYRSPGAQGSAYSLHSAA